MRGLEYHSSSNIWNFISILQERNVRTRDNRQPSVSVSSQGNLLSKSKFENEFSTNKIDVK